MLEAEIHFFLAGCFNRCTCWGLVQGGLAAYVSQYLCIIYKIEQWNMAFPSNLHNHICMRRTECRSPKDIKDVKNKINNN